MHFYCYDLILLFILRSHSKLCATTLIFDPLAHTDAYEYISMISLILTNEPAPRANIEKTIKNRFLTKIILQKPKSLGYRKMVSTSAGTNKPRNEKKTAPTKPMNGANFGIMMATMPITKTHPPRNPLWAMLCLSFDIFGESLPHKMSMGTTYCKPSVNWIAIPMHICATWANLCKKWNHVSWDRKWMQSLFISIKISGRLRLIRWQIQRDTSFSVITICHVSKDADQCVQTHNCGHGYVQNTGTAKEMLWLLHGVFNWHHSTDSFHRENYRTEIFEN